MRPVDFWLLGIWASVMGLAASSWMHLLFTVLSYLAVLLALIASFRTFQREQLAHLAALPKG